MVLVKIEKSGKNAKTACRVFRQAVFALYVL
jgi:hypothetical protein